MTPEEKADKVVQILELVDGNVRHAFKLRSYFCHAAYNDDVKKCFDQSKAASGYNQILNSLYFEFIMTLVRLFDNIQNKKSAHNTASIPGLMSLLRETQVVDELLKRSAQRKTLSGDLETHLNSADLDYLKRHKACVIQAVNNERSQIENLPQNSTKLKGSHLLNRLRTVRNEFFAHTAIECKRNNLACYGIAEELLDKTAEFVASLNSSIRSLHDDYKGEIKKWEEYAKYFWEHIVGKGTDKSTSQST